MSSDKKSEKTIGVRFPRTLLERIEEERKRIQKKGGFLPTVSDIIRHSLEQTLPPKR